MPPSPRHGSDTLYAVPELAEALGKVSGCLFHDHSGSCTISFVSDTIYFSGVETTLSALKPDMVVINVGDAQSDAFGGIIMGQDDIGRLHALLPDAIIVPVHLEAVNH